MRRKGGQSTIQNKVFVNSFTYSEEANFKTLLRFVFQIISPEHLHTKSTYQRINHHFYKTYVLKYTKVQIKGRSSLHSQCPYHQEITIHNKN